MYHSTLTDFWYRGRGSEGGASVIRRVLSHKVSHTHYIYTA